MHLTAHGVKRVFGRTRLSVKNIMSIVAADAVVDLGSDDEFEYLLFYSPPNKNYKIAVTSKGRRSLVSIWNGDFVLPQGILRPSRCRRDRAQKKMSEYIFARATSRPSVPDTQETDINGTPAEKGEILDVDVEVEVRMNKCVEYKFKGGKIAWSKRHKMQEIVKSLSTWLQLIVDTIENNPDKVYGDVGFMLHVNRSGDNPRQGKKIYLSYIQMKDRLRAAAQ